MDHSDGKFDPNLSAAQATDYHHQQQQALSAAHAGNIPPGASQQQPLHRQHHQEQQWVTVAESRAYEQQLNPQQQQHPAEAAAAAAAYLQSRQVSYPPPPQPQSAMAYQQAAYTSGYVTAASQAYQTPQMYYHPHQPAIHPDQAAPSGPALVRGATVPIQTMSASAVAAAAAGVAAYPPIPQPPPPPQPFIQPKQGRLPANRPLIKLSVSLIDTYKHINTVYYEERDRRRLAREKEKGKGPGTNNNGWDDENYDYIVTQGELLHSRYRIKERIGKGSFGQVVRAEDITSKREVAIKIIKSKKPFLMQAKTEIELLEHLFEKDVDDQHNIVRLLTHFMYRNHQCLVFEMLSLNLYELLKNTQFGGVSLNLIRKFAKQVLKALAFLSRSDVDVIHCDLKPENILLRHPKKSGVKVIDFGSSCRSNKRMYSYIQSRFYRSPEVMLGLPYSVAIDMWSLGCILAEMHTGEPLFSGSDQFDQMQKIIKLLGMVPDTMLSRASDQIKSQFFEKRRTVSGREDWRLRQTKQSSSSTKTEAPAEPKQIVVPSTDPIASLTEVITAGVRQKKKFPPSEAYNSQRNYELFIDLVFKMLAFEPEERIKPQEALNHPFIIAGEQQQQHQLSSVAALSAQAAGTPR